MDYYADSINYKQTYDNDFLIKENRKLKDNLLNLEIALEMMTHFFNRIQNLVSKQPGGFVLLDNLDSIALRNKLNSLEEEVEKTLKASRPWKERSYNNDLNDSIGRSIQDSKKDTVSKLQDLAEENELLRYINK